MLPTLRSYKAVLNLNCFSRLFRPNPTDIVKVNSASIDSDIRCDQMDVRMCRIKMLVDEIRLITESNLIEQLVRMEILRRQRQL